MLGNEMDGGFGFSSSSSKSKGIIPAPLLVIQECQRLLAKGKEKAEWERTRGRVTLGTT